MVDSHAIRRVRHNICEDVYVFTSTTTDSTSKYFNYLVCKVQGSINVQIGRLCKGASGAQNYM